MTGLEELRAHEPAYGIINTVARHSGQKKPGCYQRHVKFPAGAQSPDYEYKRVAGEESGHNEPCFAEYYRINERVDQIAVIFYQFKQMCVKMNHIVE